MLRKSLLLTLILSVVIGTWAVFAQVPPGPGPSFFFTGTAVNVSGTSTETNVLAVPITAGYVTDGVHCHILGQITTTGTPNFTINTSYGTGASLSIVNTLAMPAGVISVSPIVIDLYLQQTGASTTTQELLGVATAQAFGVSPVLSGRLGQTQTSTSALNLNLTVLWGTSASNNFFKLNAANCSLGT